MDADGYPFVEQREEITGEQLRYVTSFQSEFLLTIPDIIKDHPSGKQCRAKRLTTWSDGVSAVGNHQHADCPSQWRREAPAWSPRVRYRYIDGGPARHLMPFVD